MASLTGACSRKWTRVYTPSPTALPKRTLLMGVSPMLYYWNCLQIGEWAPRLCARPEAGARDARSNCFDCQGGLVCYTLGTSCTYHGCVCFAMALSIAKRLRLLAVSPTCAADGAAPGALLLHRGLRSRPRGHRLWLTG